MNSVSSQSARPLPGSTAGTGHAGSSNKLALDYRREAALFPRVSRPIIDAHSHVMGRDAAGVYVDAARAFGVRLTYSMTPLPLVKPVREVMGQNVRFIAIQTWTDPDRNRAHRQGYIDAMETLAREHGSRMMKIWSAPRLRELFPGESGADLVEIDSPWRVKMAQAAEQLGMMIMVHVADPDTWFATKYSDAKIYRTKREQYIGLERMLDRFTCPWIAAHMGGSSEDLDFLDGLLTRHPNLHIDTSATKWVVRELSKHPVSRVLEFFTRWQDRILFGTDIVTSDDHLKPAKDNPAHPKADQANSPESAFDLYASRFWALRSVIGGGYAGPSPIADGDLAMVDPARFSPDDAPMLRGVSLPDGVLDKVMFANAERVVGGWWNEHGGW